MISSKMGSDVVRLVEYSKPTGKEDISVAEFSDAEIGAILKECGSGWSKVGKNEWRDETGKRTAFYLSRRLRVGMVNTSFLVRSGKLSALPPVEISLRNAGQSSEQIKEACKAIDWKMAGVRGQNADIEDLERERLSRVDKDNPDGRFITVSQLIERLKKRERFVVSKFGVEDCFSCETKGTDCESCAGKGQFRTIQEVNYLW